MAASRPGKRLYSEPEVGRLIQRATEIQTESKAYDDHGLSLEEIQVIAAEIGIDPAHLREAVRELENRPHDDRRFRMWGGPFEFAKESLIEGPITDAEWERIVLGLRRLTGSSGTTSQIGQIREWARTIEDLGYRLEQTRVSIRSGEDQTSVSVRKDFRGGARMAYVIGVLVSGTIAGVFLDGAGLSDLMNATVLGGSGLGGLLAVRTSLAIWSRRQRDRFRDLTDWLHGTLAPASESETGAQAAAERLRPVIDQDVQQEAVPGRRVRT